MSDSGIKTHSDFDSASDTEFPTEQERKVSSEERSHQELNNYISVVVALTASLMAIFNIKDNNIVQAMSQAQARALNRWSYYQSKSLKQHLAESAREQAETQLELMDLGSPSSKKNSLGSDDGGRIEARKKMAQKVSDHQRAIEKYEKEKNQIKTEAEGFEKQYDDLNIHDDQFDLAEALLSLGISIFGITALTRKKPLFLFGLALSIFGVIFGLAGFFGWKLHPEWLTQILS